MVNHVVYHLYRKVHTHQHSLSMNFAKRWYLGISQTGCCLSLHPLCMLLFQPSEALSLKCKKKKKRLIHSQLKIVLSLVRNNNVFQLLLQEQKLKNSNCSWELLLIPLILTFRRLKQKDCYKIEPGLGSASSGKPCETMSQERQKQTKMCQNAIK